MLQSILIKNYAIIDEVTLNFDDGFNVITGETGAGKSILLGALNLILGARADTKVLYDLNAKCIVEATFKLNQELIQKLAEQADADFEDNEVSIRREISSTGKSRAFLNDTPVKLSEIKNVSNLILDIHNQFDTLSIASPEFQLNVVDLVAQNGKEQNAYTKDYLKYTDLLSEIRKLSTTQKQSAQDLEFIKFQLEELDNIPLDNLVKQEIIDEHATLSNSERILTVIQSLNQELQESEHSVSSRLDELARPVNDLASINPQLAEIKEQIDTIQDGLREIDIIASRLADNIDVSDQRLTELTDTLDHINKLEKKHSVNSVADLIELRDSYRLRTEGVIDVDALLASKKADLDKHKKVLFKTAEKLTASREKVYQRISNVIEKTLSNLAIPNAQLSISTKELPDYTPTGLDEIVFAFSANKGIAPQPIADVASGGELSRLALGVKSMIAEQYGVPTLIFDEIDSGISGAVAKRVGEILIHISDSRQVICITHSPQVASQVGKHFLVAKRDTKTRTFTTVKELSVDERIDEIAKMLSEDPPTGSARQNARELLEG